MEELRRDTGGISPGEIGGHKKRVLSGTNAELRKRIHAEGLSLKTILPAERDRPDIARKRLRWKAHPGRIDASRLIFIDET